MPKVNAYRIEYKRPILPIPEAEGMRVPVIPRGKQSEVSTLVELPMAARSRERVTRLNATPTAE